MTPESLDRDNIIAALEPVAQNGIPGPGTAHILDIGTDGYLRYFEKEVFEQLLLPGGSTCRFYEGSYGSGKTHLLDLLEDMGMEMGMTVTRIDLSQSQSLADWKLITSDLLENMCIKIDGEIVNSLPEILERLGSKGVPASAFKNAIFPHAGFHNAMYYALNASSLNDMQLEALRTYLLGGKIGVTKMRGLGLKKVSSPLTEKNSEVILKTVFNGLYALGVKGNVVLFDENEKTLYTDRATPPKKLIIAANVIRRLIDGCASRSFQGTLFAFSVLPNFLEECARVYPALGQRLKVEYNGSRIWRRPVLPIIDLNTTTESEEFLEKAVDKYVDMVKRCGGNIDGLKDSMMIQGNDVISLQSGSGYRRDLMKLLSLLALQKIAGDDNGNY